MSEGLKSKTFHGLFWSFSQSIGQQGIRFVIAVILARLLMPEEFGLIAMLMIFISVAQVFVRIGFGQALIQKQDATHVDESSIFYFNVFLGIVLAGFLCLIAPWIAAFYEKPILTPLTRVVSLNLVIGAFGIVQTMVLTKQVDFKTQLKVSMLATTLSGIIGITMAYSGFGVWSLVAQSLSSTSFSTVFLWLFYHWRPAWVFSFVSLRSMFSFSSKLLLSNLLNTIFENLHIIVIGKLFSAADLGFYSRAKGLQELPVYNVNESVSRVTFPIFSSVQHDSSRLKRGVRKLIAALALANFPMMIGLAIIARPLVFVLLTEKWLPCVPYLQLFCAVGLLFPLHTVNLNVLVAQGRSDLFLRLEIIKKVMVIVAIIITYRWGVSAMIFGQLVTSILTFYLNTYYTNKLIDYSFIEQIRDILPSFILAILMGTVTYTLHYVPFPNPATLLAAQVVLGGVFYISLCYLFKPPLFLEVVEILQSKLKLYLRTS